LRDPIVKMPPVPRLLLLLLLALPLSARGVDIMAADSRLRWAGRVNVVGSDVQFDFPGVSVSFSVVGTSTVDMVVRKTARQGPPPPASLPASHNARNVLRWEWC
jgi:hypothetical protein